MNKGIVELHEELKSKKTTSEKLVKESLELAHECQELTN